MDIDVLSVSLPVQDLDVSRPWYQRFFGRRGANCHSSEALVVLTTVALVDPSVIEQRVRAICLALPGVTEKVSHGSPAFFAGKQFLMLWVHGHHDHQFPHLWCAAPPGAQAELVMTEGERFFRPPYVGGRGWVGVRLDGTIDWRELEAICEDAYRTVASKRLLATLDADKG